MKFPVETGSTLRFIRETHTSAVFEGTLTATGNYQYGGKLQGPAQLDLCFLV